MSVYYDLYTSGNPQQRDEQRTLYARVAQIGTIGAKKFAESVAKTSGFSQATIEGCLQAVTDELQRRLAEGWLVEVGELGHFSLSLKCERTVTEKKDIRSPSIRLNKINLRVNRRFRKKMEQIRMERVAVSGQSGNGIGEERCRQLLMEHLQQQGCITRSDFMRITGLTRSAAIRLLRQYTEEGMLRKYGGGRAAVYLL